MDKGSIVLLFVLAFAPAVCAQQPGGWKATDSLSAGHGGPTATLLTNGKVLVVGGSYAAGSAELYDPETGKWSPTGNLITPRWGHIAVRLQNGKVLVAGGSPGNLIIPVLSSAEIYDPVTGEWTSAGNLSVPRVHHTANLLPDGAVLVAGGLNYTGMYGQYQTYDSAEIYDPATGVWSSAGTMPSPHSRHASTLLRNGDVLVIGGDNNHVNQRKTSRFDLATRTWAATGDLQRARWEPRATLLRDGRVLVAGADGGENEAEIYDPLTGEWSATGNMTVRRRDHTMTLLPDGKVLAAGGHKNDEDYFTGEVTVLDSTELYDPMTGLWSPSESMNAIRYGHTATQLKDGRVLVAAGYVNGGILRTAEIYRTASPQLTLNSTNYCVGASWSLRVTSLVPNISIRLAGTSNGASWEIPNWRKTDDTGSFTETGTFSPGTEGAHAIFVDVGGTFSNEVSFSVARC